jgi:hypothetical protein
VDDTGDTGDTHDSGGAMLPGAAGTAAAPTSTSPDPAGALRRRRLQRLLPFLSLVTATVSAALMERDSQRASLVGGVALVLWAVVVVASVVVKRVDALADDAGRRARAARFAALLVSQTLCQQALAFPLPFFARAAWPLTPDRAPFVVVYSAALVIAWWDPAWAWSVRRSVISLAVQAFAAYAALVVALPIGGFDLVTSTAIAGAIVIVTAVAGALLARRRVLFAAGLGLALAGALALGARFLPPAPLSLARATFAVDVVQRAPVGAATRFTAPDELVCHTAVRAPLGLRDALFHVWRHDGVVVQRVALDIAGGAREDGFRTWSKRTRPAPGRWECRVETRLAQQVGVVHAVVTAP